MLSPGSQQTLPRQFQNRIVLGGWPCEITPFHFALELLVFALNGPNPKPGQNHVHRQIRHPRVAQQRLRFSQPRRFERPVPRPEFVAPDLQNFEQRIKQSVCPAGPRRTSVPVCWNDISVRQPVRRQREPPLRMIGRAQAVKFPGRARQDAIVKFIALAPPEIPDAAQIAVRAFLRPGQFRRQQTADAEQPRLQFKRRICAARPARVLFPPDFASARRCVCSPARGTSFPTAPVPSRRVGRGREIARPCFQSGRARPGATVRPVGLRPVRATARNICRADFPAANAAIRFRATDSIRSAARRAHFSTTTVGGALGPPDRRGFAPKRRGAGRFGNSDFGRARARASRWRADQFPRRRSAARHRRFESRRRKNPARLRRWRIRDEKRGRFFHPRFSIGRAAAVGAARRPAAGVRSGGRFRRAEGSSAPQPRSPAGVKIFGRRRHLKLLLRRCWRKVKSAAIKF